MFLQSDILLLADIFDPINDLDPGIFFQIFFFKNIKLFVAMQTLTASTWKRMIRLIIKVLKYLKINNLYGKALSQNVPVHGFKWTRNKSKFNENLIKNFIKN